MVGEPDVDAAATALRRIAGLATAGMLVLSWRLWVEDGEIARVPFLPGLFQATGPLAWALSLGLVAAVVGSALARQWRPWFAASLVLLSIAIGEDQHRFQPWVYQDAMTLFFLATLPGEQGLKLARWWFVSLYLHSGLSKLDVSFCDELGPVFLRALLAPLKADPWSWPMPWRRGAALAMPLGEIAVALALLAPRWRKVGRVAALALHAGLIAILGPTGLNHSTIVLAWNAAMAAEVWVAFGPEWRQDAASMLPRWRRLPIEAVFWAGVLLPLGERLGVWDAWPSHALYASHVERVSVLIHESAVGSFPACVRQHLGAVGEPPWLRLDLNAWSLAARGTPAYPQNRAGLGLAEALAARYGDPLAVRVVAFGAADRWTGRRTRAEAAGLAEIRAMGRTYKLNSHPWIEIPRGR